MLNEYGEPLDSNGYAPSLLPSDSCWYCGRQGDLARHEAFEGTGRRKQSKALGLWVTLCPTCHALCHEHPRTGIAMMLKQAAEKVALENYDWTTPRFIRAFGQNYIDE